MVLPKKSTGLLANPNYSGFENHEILDGDILENKNTKELYEVRWWKQRGCWAAYNREKNKMIMLFTLLRKVRKI